MLKDEAGRTTVRLDAVGDDATAPGARAAQADDLFCRGAEEVRPGGGLVWCDLWRQFFPLGGGAEGKRGKAAPAPHVRELGGLRTFSTPADTSLSCS
jgi:hypothetical protein